MILRNLQDKKLITPRVPEMKLLAKIEEVITTDLAAESKLDDDVKKLMEQYRQQISSGQMDERQVFMMIKKQLIKERKMVL